jgi:hypothetical protein
VRNEFPFPDDLPPGYEPQRFPEPRMSQDARLAVEEGNYKPFWSDAELDRDLRELAARLKKVDKP